MRTWTHRITLGTDGEQSNPQLTRQYQDITTPFLLFGKMCKQRMAEYENGL